MNLDHLMWNEDGWGYLPPSEEVFSAIKETLEITQAKSLFEIGFYAGHSTTYWAEIMGRDARILSCCPDHPNGVKYGRVIMDKYPYVQVKLRPSPQIFSEVVNEKFDLAFIDGSHNEIAPMIDTFLCNQLDIPYYLYDNAEYVHIQEFISELEREGHIEVLKNFSYQSNFKGKVATNQMTLVKNTKIF